MTFNISLQSSIKVHPLYRPQIKQSAVKSDSCFSRRFFVRRPSCELKISQDGLCKRIISLFLLSDSCSCVNTWGRWKCETGKCGTGIIGTKLQGWKMRDQVLILGKTHHGARLKYQQFLDGIITHRRHIFLFNFQFVVSVEFIYVILVQF